MGGVSARDRENEGGREKREERPKRREEVGRMEEGTYDTRAAAT